MAKILLFPDPKIVDKGPQRPSFTQHKFKGNSFVPIVNWWVPTCKLSRQTLNFKVKIALLGH